MSASPNTGNRWTSEKLQEFIGLWLKGTELNDIAAHFGITGSGINKIAQRLRRNGVPLPLRKRGVKAGRRNQPWTQEEVEALIRMRAERRDTQEIAISLDRTFYGVQAMVIRLRSVEEIPLQKLGAGRARLWDADRLREAIAGRGLRVVNRD
jgi:transposase